MRNLLDRFLTRYPIRARATWAALIAAGGTLALQLGLDAQITEQAQTILTGVLNLVVLLGLVTTSEKRVTPVADPRGDDGNPLISETRI